MHMDRSDPNVSHDPALPQSKNLVLLNVLFTLFFASLSIGCSTKPTRVIWQSR